MPDIFTKNITVNYQSGLRSQSWTKQTTPVAQVVAKTLAGNPTIGTTAELLAVGEIATLGECVFQNLDPTNYLEIGALTAGPTFTPFAKILPLQQASFTPSCAVTELAAKAHTAACELDYVLYSA